MHFELIFVREGKSVFRFLFCIRTSDFSSTFSWKDSTFFIELPLFPCQKGLTLFVWIYLWASYAFQWSMCLFFHQYQGILITVLFLYVCKLNSIIPMTLFIFCDCIGCSRLFAADMVLSPLNTLTHGKEAHRNWTTCLSHIVFKWRRQPQILALWLARLALSCPAGGLGR